MSKKNLKNWAIPHIDKTIQRWNSQIRWMESYVNADKSFVSRWAIPGNASSQFALDEKTKNLTAIELIQSINSKKPALILVEGVYKMFFKEGKEYIWRRYMELKIEFSSWICDKSNENGSFIGWSGDQQVQGTIRFNDKGNLEYGLFDFMKIWRTDNIPTRPQVTEEENKLYRSAFSLMG